MAVRFDAVTEDYSSTSGLPTTVYTVLFWFKISVDSNAVRTIWSMDTGSNTVNYTLLETQANGTTLNVQQQGGSDATGFLAATVGTWYRFALVRDTPNATYYVGAAGSALTSSTFATDWTSGVTPAPTRFGFGESVFASDAINGCVANVKQYDVALTAAEIEIELQQYAPSRTSGLQRRHPFLSGTDTADYSGNARSLTASGTMTTEDGPPIPWEIAPVGLFLPAPTSTTATAQNAAATGTANNPATPVITHADAAAGSAAVPVTPVPHAIAVTQPTGPFYPGGFTGQYPDTGDDPFTVTAATGAALGATVNIGRTVHAELAAATGVAANLTATVVTNAEAGTGTGEAQQLAATVVITLANAAEATGTALQPTISPQLIALAEVALADAAAEQATAGQSVTAEAETAEATGAASNATVTTAVVALAENAAAVGAARMAATVLNTAIDAEPALAAGAAGQASAGVTPPAGSAAGTGQADNPSTQVLATAGAATGTGEAHGPSAAGTPPAGLAAGLGLAEPPTTTLSLPLGAIPATAVTDPARPAVTVSAQVAEATGLVSTAGVPAVPITATATGTLGPGTAGVGARAQPAVATGAATSAAVEAINLGPAQAAGGDGAALDPAVLVRPRGSGNPWGSLLRVLDEMAYRHATRVSPMPDRPRGWGP